MGIVLGVLADIQVMRDWLTSDEAKASLKTSARVTYWLSLMDKTLRWAETFVSTRGKLLEVISVDIWLQEMLTIVEQEAPGVKARILEQVRVRLMGRAIPDTPMTGGSLDEGSGGGMAGF